MGKGFVPRRAAFSCALLISASVALLSAAPASAAYQCEASAARGTVLGATTVEPITANKNASACKAAKGGGAAILPAPLSTSLLSAQTDLTGPAGTERSQTATATGGLADLKLSLTPNVLNQLPLESLVAQVPALTVPLVGTVDLKPAVRQLLTSATLDLLELQGATANARARCVNGRPELTGSSSVLGLKLLGQDTPVNGVVEQTLNVIGGNAINPGALNIDAIGLPAGVTLDPTVRGLLQTALGSLPAIPIPPGVVTVKITPGEQVQTATRLTRRALHVEIALLGQQLLDLVVGEATVGTAGLNCAAVSNVANAALQCTQRRLVLIDVFQRRGRVQLYGAADPKYRGKRIRIFFPFTGRRVALTRVRRDGTFRTTAKLPQRALIGTNRARYEARLGKNRSLPLKLTRRMIVTGVRVSGGRVRIRGYVKKPLATPVRPITVKQRVSCTRSITVGKIRPSRSGRFSVTLKAPKKAQAGTYRLSTFVKRRADRPRLYPTFTLPRYVDLARRT